MPQLILSRPFRLTMAFSACKVWLNDEEVGTLKIGKPLEVEIPDGPSVLTLDELDYTLLPGSRQVIEAQVRPKKVVTLIHAFEAYPKEEGTLRLFCPFAERVTNEMPAHFTREQRTVVYIQDLLFGQDGATLMEWDGHALAETLEEIGIPDTAARIRRVMASVPGGYRFPVADTDENYGRLQEAWQMVWPEEDDFDQEARAIHRALIRFALQKGIA